MVPEPCGHLFLGPIAPEYFSRRALHFWFFHKKIISQIPLRDFAFSGSQKLKNLLASQGRRLKAGVAKDLGQNRTPLPEAHDTSACPQVRGPSVGGVAHAVGGSQRCEKGGEEW